MSAKTEPEPRVREIRRKTRRQYRSEEKIRMVLEGLKGEDDIAEPCRREGNSQNLSCARSKGFLGAGKRRLSGDTRREVTTLRQENGQLKHLVAELALRDLRVCIGLRTL